MNDIGIFLDRDGTINHEVDFLHSPTDLNLLPRSANAIHEANMQGWKVFIITNQSGIARGILTEDQLLVIHRTLGQELLKYNAKLDAIYYCPHHPDIGEPPFRKECECRKPKIGMLEKAAAEYNINLKNSFVIGDKMIDVQTGKNSGVTSILVLTGYGKTELELCRKQNVLPDFIANNLYDAIQFVRRTVQNEIPISMKT
ncbi:MAG: HAD family hydrolase [Bacteroidota bacterium]|nr:HAD family hydrolase [Bacteroidota bacterium]